MNNYRLFGTRLTQAASVVESHRNTRGTLKLGPKNGDSSIADPKVQAALEVRTAYTKLVMQVVLSAAVAGVALWGLMNDTGGNPAAQKSLAGALGTVIGYWLT